jgi:hypothetical protein
MGQNFIIKKSKLSLCLTKHLPWICIYRLIKHHAIKMYCVSGGIALRFLNLGSSGGEWSASRLGRFTPGGKNLPYQLDRRLGGPHIRSGSGDKEKKSQHCPLRKSNLGRPARILVSVLTELLKLSKILQKIRIGRTDLSTASFGGFSWNLVCMSYLWVHGYAPLGSIKAWDFPTNWMTINCSGSVLYNWSLLVN